MNERQQYESVRRAFNKIFGSRKARRAFYRRYLKKNGVPKPLFPKISEKLHFNKLNEMTFMEDMKAMIEAPIVKTDTGSTQP